jgi:hypothetical protein
MFLHLIGDDCEHNLTSLKRYSTALQVRQRRSIASPKVDSEPGDSPGAEDLDGTDMKNLLDSFKVSAARSNQFKKPRRHKVLA